MNENEELINEDIMMNQRKSRMKRFTIEGMKISTQIDDFYNISITFDSRMSGRIKQLINNILRSVENVTKIKFTDGHRQSFHYSYYSSNSLTPIDYYESVKSQSDPIASIKVSSSLENSSLAMAHNVLSQSTLKTLGLSKSSDINAVMYPKLASVVKNLSIDDITALQMLYGSNPNNPTEEFLGTNPKAFDL